MAIFPRISGRLGNTIDLNITFYKDGVPTDPFAVRKVQIYKSAVQPENLIAEFPITDPLNPSYPSPLSRELINGELGQCGTAPLDTIKPGVFHLLWNAPNQGVPVPDIFFDVWSFLTEAPPGLVPESGLTDLDQEVTVVQGITEIVSDDPDLANDLLLNDESRWNTCCEKFWLFSDNFYCDSGLENFRIGFEAIDVKFYQPEIRTLEIGLMPLPLYDFDFNRVAPIIPQLKGTFTLTTDQCEIIIDHEPMKIGLRQGSYRTSPFVLQYLLDTRRVLKGSYRYKVEVALPNGETRVSPNFDLQVS